MSGDMLIDPQRRIDNDQCKHWDWSSGCKWDSNYLLNF